jgi:hypothetical protein
MKEQTVNNIKSFFDYYLLGNLIVIYVLLKKFPHKIYSNLQLKLSNYKISQPVFNSSQDNKRYLHQKNISELENCFDTNYNTNYDINYDQYFHDFIDADVNDIIYDSNDNNNNFENLKENDQWG